jgi:hypothetical protein
MFQRLFVGLIAIILVVVLSKVNGSPIEEIMDRKSPRTNSRMRPTADLMNGLWARIGKRNENNNNLSNDEFDNLLESFINELKTLEDSQDRQFLEKIVEMRK